MHKEGGFTGELQDWMVMWINDVEKVRAIVNALSDEYSRKIIAATVPKAKSPEQISEEQGIPVSTCYRRIHDLLTLSIIHVSRIDLANGKKSVLYKSAYKNILVKFESNELAVDLVPNTNSPSDNLSDMWSTIQGQTNNIPSAPTIVIQDCDLCQSKDGICKVFVTGDSKSYLSVCAECEKRMHERNTIRAVENVARERVAQSVLNRSNRN
jgi:predicted DNA-binding ArsR family transcriptional regulator